MAGVRERLRAAVQGWRLAGARAGGDGARTPALVWPTRMLGQPSWNLIDLQSYINYGFSLNSIIYSAIMYKVRACSSAPLQAFERRVGDGERLVRLPADHPLARLLERPNPFQSAYSFHALNTVYFNLAGNAFIYLARERAGALPYAMYPLRPDCVRIIPDREAGKPVVGFVYIPDGGALADGFPILAEDMIHVKLPNPGDPLNGAGYGLSPLSALARSANIDNDVTTFLKAFFERGAMFQTVLKFDTMLSPDEASRARERFEEVYGGVEKWSRVVVLDQGGSVERLTPTFEEMGFEVIDARNEARILGPFGVPPILTGTRLGLSASTYANYELARKAFWQDTMLPELRLFQDEYQRYLGSVDIVVRFDFSDVPALRDDRLAQTQAALNLARMGVPPRQAFAAVGLEVEAFPGDDQAWTMLGGTEAALGHRGAGQETKAAPVASVVDPAGMRLKMDDLATSHESRYGEVAARLFAEEGRELQALLGDAQRAARARKGSIVWSQLMLTIREWYERERIPAWRDAFIPLIEATMLETGKEWALALGVQWTVRTLRGEDWFQRYMLTFANPITATSSEQVHRVLEQAMAEGWSIPQTQERLGLLFQQWAEGTLTPGDFEWMRARFPAYRRENIARTETLRAANAGAFELGKSWGVRRKAWEATADSRTRDDHLDAWQRYRAGGNPGPIPIDEPFIVGGVAMMYPGDPAGTPEQFCNCRCTVLLYAD